MNPIVIIVALLCLIIALVAFFFRDKDGGNIYKDVILPIQGSKFKGNL